MSREREKEVVAGGALMESARGEEVKRGGCNAREVVPGGFAASLSLLGVVQLLVGSTERRTDQKKSERVRRLLAFQLIKPTRAEYEFHCRRSFRISEWAGECSVA